MSVRRGIVSNILNIVNNIVFLKFHDTFKEMGDLWNTTLLAIAEQGYLP